MVDSSSDRSAAAPPDGLPAAAWAAALEALVDASGAALAVKHAASGRIVWANRRFAEIFGAGQPVLGAPESALVAEAASDAWREAELAALAGAAPLAAPQRTERGGQRRDFVVAQVGLHAAGTAATHVATLWVETTDALRREQQLQHALAQIEQQQASAEAARREAYDRALRDEITGLYQRPQFDDLLRREVDLSSREHREFALAAIEVDPFADAVRALGAAAEQRILEAIGRLLRGNTRAMDASCRLDGRRFAVLLSGVGLATAHSRMESMRRQCATQIVVLEGRNIGFTVSMGVASFPHTAHTQDELMRAADAALAEARRRGGNHVTLASIRFESA